MDVDAIQELWYKKIIKLMWPFILTAMYNHIREVRGDNSSLQRVHIEFVVALASWFESNMIAVTKLVSEQHVFHCAYILISFESWEWVLHGKRCFWPVMVNVLEKLWDREKKQGCKALKHTKVFSLYSYTILEHLISLCANHLNV